MAKLSMCRICLVENVRMCVVTNKSLQETYEKLADVPFVTEDRKPMLACLFCCTRLKQCCQLQRQCVAAEELLAQMLSEDYEQKSLTNRGHLGFVGRFIITPIEHINIVDDCQIGSDAIKQEPPDVCEEQGDVELQPTQPSEELDPESISHSDIKDHHSESESEEDQLVMEIKIEGEEKHERHGELELKNLDKINPGVEIIPVDESKSDSEDNVPLKEIMTQVEEGLAVPKRKRRACVIQRAAIAKKPTLKRKLEDTISAKQSMDLLRDSTIIRRIETSTSESVAKIKEPITTTSQSSLSQSSNLIQHTLIHTSEKPFKCDVCQLSFTQKSSLKIHSRLHTGEKPYKCDVCQRSFTQNSSLKKHSRLHTGEKPYKCDVCQNSFTNKSTLTYHTSTHTSEKPYKCNICWRGYRKLGYLNKHIRIHTGEKPYKCDVCQRSFRFKSNLKVHMIIHSGENPFKCDVCQRTFAQSSNLKQHIRVHTGEKPYKCDVCQRSFNFKNNLVEHFRKHSGENPFKCDICQQSFGQSSHLKQHIRVHTGEKPYKCDVCQRSFTQSSHLKQHVRVHIDE